jgi:DNA-binding LytR/AlgR family response regulator
MPGLTGLEVAAAAAEASPQTQIVFVTAYDQYAIAAFERGAIDYLLKPVTAERIVATAKRLKARTAGAAAQAASLAAIIEQLRAHLPAAADAPALTWITASFGKETRLIAVDDVAYFRSDTKYTLVMTAEGEALIRKPLRELLEALDRKTFRQIHRSVIVNMKAVAAITRDETGRGTVRLKNRPETLPVSVAFMPLFRNM